MIKILTTAQINELDKATIELEPVSSIELMERASRTFVTWFTGRYHALKKVALVCGTGNNGGDGLAVTRMLKDWGYPVTTYVVRGSAPVTTDFQVNYERLKVLKISLHDVSTEKEIPSLDDFDIIIDALFGSGLSRPAEGIYAAVIETMNRSSAERIALDMPSGLMADKPSSGKIVQADFTLSFQVPKLCFFFPGSHRFTGEWITEDIGLNRNFIREAKTNHFYLTLKGVKKMIRTRSRFDHKGTFGHALLFAGSYGRVGAAVLASQAILRAGVGLLTVCAPRCGYTVLQTSVPEAMVMSDPAEEHLSTTPDLSRADVVGIGPGIGQDLATVKMFRTLLMETTVPLVIDADALNILATNSELLHLIPAGSILTPHPKEFERLVGTWKDDFERLDLQKNLAARLNSVVILKGAFTSIASPDGRVYFNSTGNPGMATGGSGDVLTGILTGLRAQGYAALDAAILGVYLHGTAGDLAVLETGMEGLIASDLIRFLPPAFRQVNR